MHLMTYYITSPPYDKKRQKYSSKLRGGDGVEDGGGEGEMCGRGGAQREEE